jgi:5-methyltetrahydrofolate--homocysteine methyltransferase
MSNVSFGIPARKLINEAFLRLAIDAGADSGIIDPVSTEIEKVRAIDLDAGAYALARDAITGADPGCRLFLKAYRAGEFAEHGLLPPNRRVAA